MSVTMLINLWEGKTGWAGQHYDLFYRPYLLTESFLLLKFCVFCFNKTISFCFGVFAKLGMKIQYNGDILAIDFPLLWLPYFLFALQGMRHHLMILGTKPKEKLLP